MFIYRKPSKKREQLARKQAREYKENRTCPGCGGNLELTEAGKDRNSYVCVKCGAVATFTISLPEAKQQKETKLKLITVRDKSKKEKPEKPKIENEELQVVLDTIRESMEEKRLLAFVYVDRTGRKSGKTVEPYKLTMDGSGNPILYGFCTEAEGTRMFKLAKMFKLEIQTFPFKPKWDMEDKLAET